MRNTLLIIGASGHGKVVADIALKMQKWRDIYFLDDNENLTSSMGITVVGKTIDAYKYLKDCDIFIGIGNNTVRETLQKKLEDKGAHIPTLIHPTAILGEQVEISPGTVVMAGTVINSCSEIGKGCIINTGSTIDHDCIIEDYVHISPGAHLAGTVKVGQGTWLGIGSIVSNNVNISYGCKIGAGAVVIRDLTVTGTYVGVPAKKID
jgi:sugar O-acyltransferase (sialic acid O-acetyltransferase NeuD family)